MSSLRELQESMQAYIIEDDAAVVSELVQPDAMKVEGRLNVYRNGYYIRLVEILESDFTALYKIMGKDAFAAMMRDYLRTYPSNDYSVRAVGRHFARFLQNTGCDPSYVELAEFELAFNAALVAKEAEVLIFDQLAAFPQAQWPTMRLLLHPSVHVLTCYYNTLLRWQSLDAGEGDLSAVRYDAPHYHLIWRQAVDVYFCEISPEQHRLMQGIQQGNSFSELCESLLDYFEEDQIVPWVVETLQQWISDGLFSEIG